MQARNLRGRRFHGGWRRRGQSPGTVDGDFTKATSKGIVTKANGGGGCQ
ncbi:C2H2-type domain-containing protein [Psidium guajava]|nr:C2H2-type domain-containing protein [Psidium guajava]